MDVQIDRAFFETDPLTCAQSLIGCELVWGKTAGRIVETEAYAEHNDQASHTFLRQGAREFIKMNPAGTLYVYLNYGVHWLLNFLVKGEITNGFVLIRALEPTDGRALMTQRRATRADRNLCSGPGKLTQALAIDWAFHGLAFAVHRLAFGVLCNARKFSVLSALSASSLVSFIGPPPWIY